MHCFSCSDWRRRRGNNTHRKINALFRRATAKDLGRASSDATSRRTGLTAHQRTESVATSSRTGALLRPVVRLVGSYGAYTSTGYSNDGISTTPEERNFATKLAPRLHSRRLDAKKKAVVCVQGCAFQACIAQRRKGLEDCGCPLKDSVIRYI